MEKSRPITEPSPDFQGGIFLKRTNRKIRGVKQLWIVQLVELFGCVLYLIQALSSTTYVYIKPHSFAASSFFLLEKSLLLDGIPLLSAIAFFIIPIIKAILVFGAKKQYVWSRVSTIIMCCSEIIFSIISFFSLIELEKNTLIALFGVSVGFIGVNLYMIYYSVLGIKMSRNGQATTDCGQSADNLGTVL